MCWLGGEERTLLLRKQGVPWLTWLIANGSELPPHSIIALERDLRSEAARPASPAYSQRNIDQFILECGEHLELMLTTLTPRMASATSVSGTRAVRGFVRRFSALLVVASLSLALTAGRCVFQGVPKFLASGSESMSGPTHCTGIGVERF